MAARIADWAEAVDLPSRAKYRHVLTVLPSGRVRVVAAWTWRTAGQHGQLCIAPDADSVVLLGQIDPDSRDAWLAAQRLAAANGLTPVGDWTTVGRMPACLVTATATNPSVDTVLTATR